MFALTTSVMLMMPFVLWMEPTWMADLSAAMSPSPRAALPPDVMVVAMVVCS